VLRETPLDELGQTPGLLLIDEAENQLHPKWQKRFIRTILDIFPNLQIIATTHSPFIIASVQNARLYVCKDQKDHCIVVDETAEYANKPVDEILMSPLFEETLPFSEEISRLITEREQVIKAGDEQERKRIEAELQALNPEYFAYFDVDKLLEEIAGEGAAA
jgi:predicted ATP-binding protein involved in virulence